MRCKTKRRIAETLGWLCALAMLCVVDGTERGWLPLTAMWWAFLLELAGAALLWKAGVVRCRC